MLLLDVLWLAAKVDRAAGGLIHVLTAPFRTDSHEHDDSVAVRRTTVRRKPLSSRVQDMPFEDSKNRNKEVL